MDCIRLYSDEKRDLEKIVGRSHDMLLRSAMLNKLSKKTLTQERCILLQQIVFAQTLGQRLEMGVDQHYFGNLIPDLVTGAVEGRLS